MSCAPRSDHPLLIVQVWCAPRCPASGWPPPSSGCWACWCPTPTPCQHYGDMSLSHEYGVTIVTCSLAASSSPSWCGSLTSSRMPSSSRSSGTSSFPSCELTAVRLLDSLIVRSSSHGLKLPIMWVTVSAFQRQSCCRATANTVIMGPSLVYSLCLQLDYWIICNSTL